MTWKQSLICVGWIAVASLVLRPQVNAASTPNVILILADDMGWGDPQCYNPESKIPTPHMDRIAKEGMRFTDAHTPSSVCTPTRYGLMTGRYCWRTWLDKGVLDGFGPPLIEPDQTTVASFLKSQGYATACVGKWHLGMEWFNREGKPMGVRGSGVSFRPGTDVDFERPITGQPLDCGFDQYFGISASLDMSPYCFIDGRQTVGVPDKESAENRDTIFRNGVAGVKTADFTLEGVLPAFKARAVKFIEEQAADSSKPFFLYLPLNSPHLPVAPNEPFLDKSGAGLYGDFVVETDDCIGAVLAALDEAGVAENTLVIVTSDNGGLWHQWTPQEADDVAGYKPTPRAQETAQHGHHSNADFRGTKADIWEGGHRVPFLVRWPARVKPGVVNPALVCLTDVLATLAEIMGESLPEGAGPDSQSFLAALDGATRARSSVIHHSLNGTFAIRTGPWKLCGVRGSGGFSQPKVVKTKPGEPEGQLYHTKKDPQETTNLWLEEPDVVKRLQAALQLVQKFEAGNPGMLRKMKRGF